MFHVVQLHSYQPKGIEESYEEEDENWIDINEDTSSSYASVPQMQSRLSTTTSARIKSYEEVTGKSAGQIFDDSIRKPKAKSVQIQTYHPFRSETDFAAAQWFLSTGCTKGDIDRFFGDKHLRAMQNLLSFTSYDKLMGKIYDIPYGIKNNTWNITEIQVEQETIGLLLSTYQI